VRKGGEVGVGALVRWSWGRWGLWAVDGSVLCWEVSVMRGSGGVVGGVGVDDERRLGCDVLVRWGG